MDRFVDISVHKSQNGQKYFFKWLTVVASSEQLRRSMVVVGPKIRSRHLVTWPTEVCGYPFWPIQGITVYSAYKLTNHRLPANINTHTAIGYSGILQAKIPVFSIQGFLVRILAFMDRT